MGESSLAPEQYRDREAFIDRLTTAPASTSPRVRAWGTRSTALCSRRCRRTDVPSIVTSAGWQRGRVRDHRLGEDTERRVRPHGAAGGRQGLRPRLPVLPGGPGVPARAAPQPSRPCARRSRSWRKESKRVGLVGACVSDYPWIGDLLRSSRHGMELSISSLRADSLTEDLRGAARGGHRTLTIAPEAGYRAPAPGRSARRSATSSSTRPAAWSAATASRTSSATS